MASRKQMWVLWVLIIISTQIQACGIGYNSLLFATKSNIGIDIDTAPPTAEISISRTEGVIEPEFENGQTLPVLAHFSSKVNGLERFMFGVNSAFSTGASAAALSKFYSLKGNKSQKELEWNGLKLSQKPKRLPWLGSVPEEIPYLETGLVRPVYFGTHSVFGIKIEWKGTTGQYPSAIKLGFNRAELAWAPLAMEASHKSPIIVTDNSNGKTKNNEGVLLFRREDFAGARTAFETAIGQDSNLAEAHYNLSLVMAALNDQPAANVHLQRALELATLQQNPTLFDPTYIVNAPSLLALLSTDTSWGMFNDNSNKLLYTQFFATGEAATELALKEDIRERLIDEFSNKLSLLITIKGKGKVTSDPPGIDCGNDCQENYSHTGYKVTLTATGDTGSSFSKWEGHCRGTTNPLVVDMSAREHCTAIFTTP